MALPDLEIHTPDTSPLLLSRRGFLATATAALSFAAHAAPSPGPMAFGPGDTERAEASAPSLESQQAATPGQISPDFWERPRELWLRRHNTKEEERVVYWKDGELQAEGYWRACALLRDRQANLMTAIDPTVLDVLRGIHGYYEAWNWPHPIVVTSGYRTKATNAKTEKAAQNSMHLYGKAVDLFVPGIPADHVRRLGMYLQQGGVGFYPNRGFTHLDTGKLRSWRG